MTQPPMGARILVVGGGAREHAISWALAQSEHRPELYMAPGNPGMAEFGTCLPIKDGDVEGLLAAAKSHEVDLVIIGPELPLSLGLADACHRAGIRVFGPTQAAAQLETSKSYAKELMKDAKVPTADFAVFTEVSEALQYIRSGSIPVVIKADGLAAGKGVVVAMSLAEAEQAVEEALVSKRFGKAGSSVVIESYLTGKEASLMYFVAGQTAVPMLPARDHKRVGEGDTGPNTGGMGAFAPIPGFVEDGLVERCTVEIVEPTLRTLAARGITYHGVLYVGLMLTGDGPEVIEFNCRFGDPEAEVILPLLDTDLLDIMWAIADSAAEVSRSTNGTSGVADASGDSSGNGVRRENDTAISEIAKLSILWKEAKAVCVVAASAGYPDSPQTGIPIHMETTSQDVVFHAGTKRADSQQLLTAGGRVLTAVGVATSFTEARQIAYETAGRLYFDGKQLRRDIALGL